MDSARRPPGRLAAPTVGLLAALLIAAGCARSGARPAGASAPPARAPSERPAESPAPGTSGTAPGGPRAPDPSEVMTAAELASIPDPVPSSGGDARPEPRPIPPVPEPGSAAPGDTARSTGAPEPPPAADSSNKRPAGGSEGIPGGYVWRVQIFAGPDLAQADRVAREAARRLGVPYVIQYGEKRYKVRLGAFASESEAQALRERAIREGFPGAFRVRATSEATDAGN